MVIDIPLSDHVATWYRSIMDVSRNKELERSVASVAVAFGLRVSGLPEDITRCRMGYDGRLVHNGDSCHYFDASYCQST